MEKHKKGIITAAIIGILYLAIFFVCYQFFFIGQDFHLYTPDWTAKHFLWIAAIISVIPAFFGAYRFPYITLAGYILGVISGELFGRTMRVMQENLPPMPYHNGWLICISFYLGACLVGIIVDCQLCHNACKTDK